MLSQKYQWSFETLNQGLQLNIRASAQSRDDNPPSYEELQTDPEFQDFVTMCNEWHNCVQLLESRLQIEGIQAQHRASALNTDLSQRDVVLFDDSLMFEREEDMPKALDILRPMVDLFRETIGSLNDAPN